MRERTAGCLKSGGQRLLQAPANRFSRRALHYTFWAHGAGDIDLPAWWRLWLQTVERPSKSRGQNDSPVDCDRIHNGLRSFLRDFLYPFKARALAERINVAAAINRRAANLALQQIRHHTSVAEDIITGAAASKPSGAEQMTAQSLTPEEQEEKIMTLISRFRARRAEYSERKMRQPSIRRTFSDLLEDIWSEYTGLTQDCGYRNRALDNEIFVLMLENRSVRRAQQVFNSMPQQDLRAQQYKQMILTFAKQRKPKEAFALWQSALKQFPASLEIGTPGILYCMVAHRKLEESVSIWHTYARSRFLYTTMEEQLWSDVAKLPSLILMRKTLMFAALTSRMTDTLPSDQAEIAGEFVKALAKIWLKSLEALKNFDEAGSRPRILSTLRRLKPFLGADDLKLAETVFFNMQSIGDRTSDGFSVAIYEELRQLPFYKPSAIMTDVLVKIFRLNNNVTGCFMVLEDYERAGLTMTTYMCTLLAQVFAAKGELNALVRVFFQFENRDQSFDDHNASLHQQKMYNYMLHVHIGRVDPTAALESFRKLQAEYGFRANARSYNQMIQVYAAVGDATAALLWLQKLEDQGLRPDAVSFASVMNIYAKRGDIDAVQDLYDDYKSRGLPMDEPILRALVRGLVMAAQPARAERLAKKLLQSVSDKTRTHFWNQLLRAAAFSRNLAKFNALRAEMDAFGIPQGEETIGIILDSLCRNRRVEEAWWILRDWNFDDRLERKSLHYAIVMAGYLDAVPMGWRVEGVFTHMLENKVKPDINVFAILIRAAGQRDEAEDNSDGKHLALARRVFDASLPLLSPASLASLQGVKFSVSDSLKQDFYSLPYQFMVALYGSSGALEAVQGIFQQYRQKLQEVGEVPELENLPTRMLAALMLVHRQAGNDEDLERCWQVARQNSRTNFGRAGAANDESNWVIPTRRYAMTNVVNEYFLYLRQANRQDRMVEVVDELETDGFQLPGRLLNVYVRALTTSIESEHRYLAFELCEERMSHTWPGWGQVGTTKARSDPYFRQRKRQMGIEPSFCFFEYETMVRLATVLRFARSGAFLPESDVSRKRLADIAPFTVSAVASLPKYYDEEQAMFE